DRRNHRRRRCRSHRRGDVAGPAGAVRVGGRDARVVPGRRSTAAIERVYALVVAVLATTMVGAWLHRSPMPTPGASTTSPPASPPRRIIRWRRTAATERSFPRWLHCA